MNHSVKNNKNKRKKDGAKLNQEVKGTPTRQYTKGGVDVALENDFEKIPGRSLKSKDGSDYKILLNGDIIVKRPGLASFCMPVLEVQRAPSFYEKQIANREKKTKSELHKDVFYQAWDTPLNQDGLLYLLGTVQTACKVHFFFKLEKDFAIYELVISRGWPFRAIEEAYAYSFIGKYFRSKKNKKIPKTRNLTKTWMLWGGQFIKEIDEGGALSGFGSVDINKIFELIIVTVDEWIEIICPTPDWVIHKNKTYNDIVNSYLDEKFE